MASLLSCPDCDGNEIVVESKAFVSQRVSLDPSGNIDIAPFESDDVSFDDGEPMYVCQSCSYESSNVDEFVFEVQ